MQTEAYAALALAFSEPFELHSGGEDVAKQRRFQPNRITTIDLYADSTSVIMVVEGGRTYAYLLATNLHSTSQC